jgi:hypothetical protein
MTMAQAKRRTLLIGWRGGVGHATLNLLAYHPLGRRLAEGLELVLLDADASAPPAPPPGAEILAPQTLRRGDELRALLARHRIERVVDLGASNTLAAVRACAETGADYLSTCYDPLTYRAHGPPIGPHLMLGARDLLPARRPTIGRGSYLIASGMNPGVVSALLLAGLEAFATRAGVSAAHELDLHALLLTEIDTTEAQEPAARDVFAMSWSPDHCLSEILEPDALAVRGGEIARLGHRPIAARYRARCGDELAEGFVVPHEELVWLGARFPSCEMGYIYQLPPAAEASLRAYPDRPAEAWKTRRLIPPRVSAESLRGYDRVGVLLCSRRFGELWIGFTTTMDEGGCYGTNATELQVAAGVVAGLVQLGETPGLHLVEELEWRRYLRNAESILGDAEVIWDREAPVQSLAERRIEEPA